MFWYQSDWRPKFKPTITVFPERNARTGVWRTVPDLRPTCSRSANARWPARRRVTLLTAPRVYRASARGKVTGRLPSPGLARIYRQHAQFRGRPARAAGAAGPQVHAMKVGFEKYYLRKSRHGYVRLP